MSNSLNLLQSYLKDQIKWYMFEYVIHNKILCNCIRGGQQFTKFHTVFCHRVEFFIPDLWVFFWVFFFFSNLKGVALSTGVWVRCVTFPTLELRKQECLFHDFCPPECRGLGKSGVWVSESSHEKTFSCHREVHWTVM